MKIEYMINLGKLFNKYDSENIYRKVIVTKTEELKFEEALTVEDKFLGFYGMFDEKNFIERYIRPELQLFLDDLIKNQEDKIIAVYDLTNTKEFNLIKSVKLDCGNYFFNKKDNGEEIFFNVYVIITK